MAQVSSPSSCSFPSSPSLRASPPYPSDDPLAFIMEVPSADAISIIKGFLVQAGDKTDPLSAYDLFSRTVYEIPAEINHRWGGFNVQQQRPENGSAKTIYEIARRLFYAVWSAQVSDKEALFAAAYHNILHAAERIKEVYDRAEARRAAAPLPGVDEPLLSAEGASEKEELLVDEGEVDPENKPINEIKQDLKADGRSAFSPTTKGVASSALFIVAGAVAAVFSTVCAVSAFVAGAVFASAIFSVGAFLGGALCLGVLSYKIASFIRTALQRRVYEKASTPEEIVGSFDALLPRAQALFFAKAGPEFRELLLKKKPLDASLKRLDVFLRNMRAIPDDLKKKLFEDTKNRCPAPLFFELVEVLRHEGCVPEELS